MQSRVVDALHGWRWVAEGVALFRRQPLIWVALTLALFGIALLVSAFKLLGSLLFQLLSPVFLAGLMLGCKALEEGRELKLMHLFAGFRTNPTQLVTIGGVYLVGHILILGLMTLIGGASVTEAFKATQQAKGPVALGADPRLSAALWLGAGLSLPLVMAVWFAPLLVLFENMTAVPAMKQSLAACLKNLLSFMVYGFVLLLIAFVLVLLGRIERVLLGVGVLLLVPIVFATVYASYKDIFRPPPVASAAGDGTALNS